MKVYGYTKDKQGIMEIENSLKAEQAFVGGLIECTALTEEIDLICNDEGKLLGLPLNRALRDEEGRIYDVIAGTFFLCGAPEDCDHLESIPDSLAGSYRKRFDAPESFIRLNGKLICIPIR